MFCCRKTVLLVAATLLCDVALYAQSNNGAANPQDDSQQNQNQQDGGRRFGRRDRRNRGNDSNSNNNNSNGQNDNNNNNNNGSDRGRFDRGRGGFGRGGFGGGPGFGPPGGGNFGGQGGFNRFSNMSPQQREQFYSDSANRYMDSLSKAYNLNDSQKLVLQSQLDQIKSQALATAPQRDQLRQQIGQQYDQLRKRREAGEQIDPSEYRKLDEMRRNTSSGFRDWDKIATNLEKTLPPDQAEAGRKQLRQDWQQRTSQWQQDRDQRRGRDRDRNAQNGNNTQDGGGGFAGGESREDRRSRWRERFQQDNPNAGADRGPDRVREEPNSIGAWERFTRDFSRRYRFDASQDATAQSILRDVLEQRKQYEDAHKDDFTAAQQIADAEVKQKQIEYLNAPVAQLFDQLKTKLDQIPTAAQRTAAGGGASTSQPAGSTSQPSQDRSRDRRGGFRDRGDRGNRSRGEDRSNSGPRT